MLLHLGVDEARDLALIAAQHLARVVLGKIALEVLHRLRGKVVEQIGMVVVGDVVEIHEAADHVVLRAAASSMPPRPSATTSSWLVRRC